jgi:hypothetical protein
MAAFNSSGSVDCDKQQICWHMEGGGMLEQTRAEYLYNLVPELKIKASFPTDCTCINMQGRKDFL